METNEKQKPDPEEQEMFDLLNKVMAIASKKELPFLCLTSLHSMKTNAISAIGCPHCIVDLIKHTINKDPIIKKLIMGGVALHMLGKDDDSVPDIDSNFVSHAKKNTSAGN